MSVVLITGSAGLIGSEAVRFFAGLGHQVLGLDNNMRQYFFLVRGQSKNSIFQDINCSFMMQRLLRLWNEDIPNSSCISFRRHISGKTFAIPLPYVVLKTLDRIDNLLVSTLPRVFALQRRVVLEKK